MKALFLLGLLCVGCAPAEPEPGTAAVAVAAEPEPLGASVYQARCAGCHQADGQGVEGLYPPLVASSFVTGRKDRLLRIVLTGLEGRIEVQGVVYEGEMPRLWGVSDASVAAVLTYVRASWGNDAPPVTEDDVRLLRRLIEDRTAPWTPADLEAADNPFADADSASP